MNLNDVSIKELIDWRSMSKRRRTTFITKLKTPKETNIGGDGGNYWIRSVSGIRMSYKLNDKSIIEERLEYLNNDLKLTDRNQTKVMYNRNAVLLQNFVGFDFSEYRPSDDMNFLSQPSSKAYLDIKGVSVKVSPSLVFSYDDENDNSCVGGIWFITKLDGYQESEIGLYAEAIHRYASIHYSKDHQIDPKFCIAIDLSTTNVVTYNQILNKEIPSLFDSTIESLRDDV